MIKPKMITDARIKQVLKSYAKDMFPEISPKLWSMLIIEYADGDKLFRFFHNWKNSLNVKNKGRYFRYCFYYKYGYKHFWFTKTSIKTKRNLKTKRLGKIVQ